MFSKHATAVQATVQPSLDLANGTGLDFANGAVLNFANGTGLDHVDDTGPEFTANIWMQPGAFEHMRTGRDITDTSSGNRLRPASAGEHTSVDALPAAVPTTSTLATGQGSKAGEVAATKRQGGHTKTD